MELLGLISWITGAAIVAWLSYRKNEGVVFPLILSLVFSPLVGLVVVLFSCYGKAETGQELAELKALRRQVADLHETVKALQVAHAAGGGAAPTPIHRPLTEAEMLAQVQAEEAANARKMRRL